MDLGFVERAVGWRDDGTAEVEHVLRELEVEERRLELLELCRRRQDVVGVARRLGHEHVDHHDEVERIERLTHPGAVGHGWAGLP